MKCVFAEGLFFPFITLEKRMFEGVTNELIHPGRSHDFKGFHVSEIFAAMHGIGRNNPSVEIIHILIPSEFGRPAR
jgi:hypothetical protein